MHVSQTVLFTRQCWRYHSGIIAKCLGWAILSTVDLSRWFLCSGASAEVLEEYQVFKHSVLNRILSGHNCCSMGNRCHCGMDGDFPKAVKWSQLQEQSSLLCRPRLRSIYYGCQIKTLSELDQQLSSLKQVICFISLEAPEFRPTHLF